MPEPKTISVAELMDELSRLDKDDKLFFGAGDLSFYRMKQRGDKLINLEFNEMYTVTLDPADL